MSKSKVETSSETTEGVKKEKKYTIHLYVAIAKWNEGYKYVMKKKYEREKPHTAAEWEAIYQAERKRKVRD